MSSLLYQDPIDSGNEHTSSTIDNKFQSGRYTRDMYNVDYDNYRTENDSLLSPIQAALIRRRSFASKQSSPHEISIKKV